MRWIGLALGLLGIAVASLLAFGPGMVERAAQGVVPHDPHVVSEVARQRHASLVVADWHADSLLWNRDLLREAQQGHVDFPRLDRGNVAIQVFGAVTKTPRGMNYDSNDAGSDNITFLAALQRWPLRTWSSLTERALYQARKLARFAERAPDRVVLVRSAADLRGVLERRERGPDRPVAALLLIEGGHALDGDLTNLERLDAAGFRVIGLHHFFDNRLGGSLHGRSRSGLTPFGREVVRALEARQIIVDVAHSSPRVVEDVLAMATRPVVVSHTGLTAVCPSPRNLPDALMQRIAAAGGIVAIGYWDAVCDTSPRGVVASLRAAIDLLGEDHVALGSDYDGGTWTTFDTSELAILTQTMLDASFSDDEIAKVMGENTRRFLLAQLPPR
jgi:microsomal dipeptidase-like Zn-dependent dipeptidase